MATGKTKVTLDAKAGTLTIVMPVNSPPEPSKTGRTLLVATSHGGQATDVEVNGKTLNINVNAYIYATDKKSKE